MKRRWFLLPLVLAAVALVWTLADGKRAVNPLQTAIGMKPDSVERSKAKPICASPVNPNIAAPTTDCIPAHLAKLPPDPGEAGKLTIEGIDADKDGVRDDVQRWIVENWSSSERAMKALTMAAKDRQQQVILGDSLGREATRKLMPHIEQQAACSLALETPEMLKLGALQQVDLKVLNTPERFKRAKDFDYQFAHGAYILGDQKTPVEACGFDPAALPN